MTSWDETFVRWSKPPSETEEAKAERAARMVRESLREHVALKDHHFDIVAVGSYRNNTNVRSASDVDLAAVLRSATYLGLPDDGSITRESLGLGVAAYEMPQFRADISRALRERFGSSDIAPGKLTLTVDEGSARLVPVPKSRKCLFCRHRAPDHGRRRHRGGPGEHAHGKSRQGRVSGDTDAVAGARLGTVADFYLDQ